MIPYEELVEALDRYVAKNGGTPQSARVPSAAGAFNSTPSLSSSSPGAPAAAPSYAAPAPAARAVPAAAAAMPDYDAHGHDVDLPGGAFDEPHDPDMPSLASQHDD